MVSHQPVMFGGHRHCGSEDITFSLVEEQDPTCTRLNPPLLSTSTAHDMLRLHTQKFTIKRKLTKTFACVTNEQARS